MKAVRFHEHGGPDVLRYEDAPDPAPRFGRAIVRVRASLTPGWDATVVAHPTNWHEAGPVAVIRIRSLSANGCHDTFVLSAASAKRR